MAVATASRVGVDESPIRRALPWLGIAAVAIVLQILFSTTETFPAFLDDVFSDPIDAAATWGRANRRSHFIFTGFFTPISTSLEWAMATVESLLKWVPWFVLPVGVFLLIGTRRKWADATIAAAAMAYPGLVGLWDDTLETLALMAIAVGAAAIIGVPLGVWAALKPRVETMLRPVLDVMQTVPAFVYFLPLMLFFGIGRVNGAIATLIYALPPIVRLTTLGIREVPSQSVEASRMFGSNTRQTLFKVQLPMATPTILAGLNQTIMMALGIVVLAALVAAGGLGGVVLQTLTQRRTGRGIAVGLAIVAIAIVLTRIGKALADVDKASRLPRRTTIMATIGLAVATLIGRVAGVGTFPEAWSTRVFDPIDDGVVWARDNTRWLTRPLNDFIVGDVFVPVRDFLTTDAAWVVLVVVAAFVGYRLDGWKLASFTAFSMIFVGSVGLWELSIHTFVQVALAVVFSAAIAIPVGVWAGKNPRVEAALGPILDGLQTIPSLVYIIPVVILFTVGIVPGLVASVLYAIVPGIRITALGIREVPSESLEASTTFGATPRQTMLGVRIPLAAPTIVAAMNQVIMMVLAMVIIAGLVGGGGLGFEVIRALTRTLVGYGFELGVAIALMAMVLDRMTHAMAQRYQPPTGH